MMLVRERLFLCLLTAFFLFCSATMESSGKENDDHGSRSAEFINSLAQRAIDSLTNPEVEREVRIDMFRSLFSDYFAVRSIGKRALGRFWRKATSEQRMEYQKYFERLMVIAYVDRFANYAGKGLVVRDNRIEDRAIATVFSELYRQGNKKPVRIDWVVGNNGTVFKIVDVKVEGVSMTTTLRSEFTSIIRRHNGKVMGLIEELEKKTIRFFNNRQ